jgi:peptide-methionine (S)-S-oxide reductase
MPLRLLSASFGIATVFALACGAPAQEEAGTARAETPADAAKGKDKGKADPDPGAKAQTTEKATFGGGCFWCSEAVFERIPGVKSVVSGFAGGHVPNPSYRDVCTGLTGHAEVVQVEYDPLVVSYEKLLSVFWKSHDPTTLNQQGDDFGTQYRSIILYSSEAQKQAAIKSFQDLKARKVFRNPIVTDLVPLDKFYPAEAYHQDYYRNHRGDQYSDFYIVPKLRKLKLKP